MTCDPRGRTHRRLESFGVGLRTEPGLTRIELAGRELDAFTEAA
jgi:hypothetical protein